MAMKRILNCARLAAAYAALALITACQSAPVRIETIEVKIPVPVQPIKPEDVPAPPASLGPRPATLPQAADRALAGWCEAVAYMLKAQPLLQLSAGLPPIELGKYPECEKK
jgi:hypothetical protein